MESLILKLLGLVLGSGVSILIIDRYLMEGVLLSWVRSKLGKKDGQE